MQLKLLFFKKKIFDATKKLFHTTTFFWNVFWKPWLQDCNFIITSFNIKKPSNYVNLPPIIIVPLELKDYDEFAKFSVFGRGCLQLVSPSLCLFPFMNKTYQSIFCLWEKMEIWKKEKWNERWMRWTILSAVLIKDDLTVFSWENIRFLGIFVH